MNILLGNNVFKIETQKADDLKPFTLKLPYIWKFQVCL